MSGFCHSLWAIVVKDVVAEFRSRQVLPTMIVLGMLIVWVMRIVSEATVLSSRVMAPAGLWIAFLFCGLLVQERSFAVEEKQDCIAALLLAPIDAGTIYLAKLLVNVFILCVFEIIIVPIVLLAFGIGVPGRWPTLVAVLLLGNVAISSVGTIFSAMVQLSHARGALLSILVLVILLPIMVPAIFALLVLFEAVPPEQAGTGILAMVGSLSNAVGYMTAFDALFTTVCWLLFGFVVQ